MKILLSTLAALMLAVTSYAGDLYQINNYNTLVTATRAELETFMYLNQTGQKSAIRALYNSLRASNALSNIQPGTYVEVTYYFNDGIAKIVWGGGNYAGYIATADLSQFLGSR